MAIITPGFTRDAITVAVWTGKITHKNKIWLCLCQCGNMVELSASSILYRKHLHCGCLTRIRSKSIANSLPPVLHAHMLAIWRSMRNSCNDINHPAYPDIGARGITYCKSFDTFSDFVKSVPKGYTINHVLERKNPLRGYTPSNVRWVAHRIKSMARTTLICPVDGSVLTFNDFAKKHNIRPGTLRRRVLAGYSGLALIDGD